MEKDKFMELLIVLVKEYFKDTFKKMNKNYTDKELENIICNIGLYIMQKNKDIILK